MKCMPKKGKKDSMTSEVIDIDKYLIQMMFLMMTIFPMTLRFQNDMKHIYMYIQEFDGKKVECP